MSVVNGRFIFLSFLKNFSRAARIQVVPNADTDRGTELDLMTKL